MYVFLTNCLFALQLNKVMNEMSTIYGTGTVCKIDDPFDCETLEPGTATGVIYLFDHAHRAVQFSNRRSAGL